MKIFLEKSLQNLESKFLKILDYDTFPGKKYADLVCFSYSFGKNANRQNR